MKLKSNTKIKRTMTFSEIIERDPKIAIALAERGMFCCSCPMARMETLEDGCKAHGIDPDKLIKELIKNDKSVK